MLAHFVITKVKQFSKTHFKFDTIDKSKISVAIPTPPPPLQETQLTLYFNPLKPSIRSYWSTPS